MIDIKEMPHIIEIINAALNMGKVVEIKNESRKLDTPNIVVVETSRKVLTNKVK